MRLLPTGPHQALSVPQLRSREKEGGTGWQLNSTARSSPVKRAKPKMWTSRTLSEVRRIIVTVSFVPQYHPRMACVDQASVRPDCAVGVDATLFHSLLAAAAPRHSSSPAGVFGPFWPQNPQIIAPGGLQKQFAERLPISGRPECGAERVFPVANGLEVQHGQRQRFGDCYRDHSGRARTRGISGHAGRLQGLCGEPDRRHRFGDCHRDQYCHRCSGRPFFVPKSGRNARGGTR